MATTLNGLFNEFLTNIEPDEEMRVDAISAHEGVRDWLAGHKEFKSTHVETFLAGSYRRRTSVAPIKDVDIVVICSMDAYDESNPRPLLDRLKQALDDNKKYKTKTRPRRRSIQIESGKVEMDIVPTVAPNGVDKALKIPDRDVERWFWTHPKGHIQWTQSLNAATQQGDSDRGRFVPLVKMAKFWRGQQLRGKRHPKGHMVELCAGYYHDPAARDWADVFIAWLERSRNGLSAYKTLRTVPQFPDPGLPGQFIQTGMEWDDFERFYLKIATALPVAEEARRIAATDLAESARLWQSLFGATFPSPDKGGQKGGRGPEGAAGGPPSAGRRPDVREAPYFG